MRDFRRYQVWGKAHALTLAVYDEVGRFPSHELFGLTSQLRRASSSIGMNIAEGCGFDSDAEFARFVRIAAGSASEVEYGLLLSRDLGYLPADKHTELERDVQEVKQMLYALGRRLKGEG